ncbi:MAG: GTPase [Nanoarchaeota archaeon]
MASTNQSPQYQKAEVNFLNAKNDTDRLVFLEEMIRECPKHKSSEKMLANLKTRLIKLKEKIARQEKTRKSGKSSRQGIRKEDMQAVIVGFANSGKSSLISSLTKATPEISQYPVTTRKPEVGMMPYSGMNIQLVEIPAIKSEYYDKGVVHTADTILILVNKIEEIDEIKKEIGRFMGKQIIIFNKSDLLSEEQKRKISSNMQSKKYDFILISTKTKENIEKLKEKIFKSFDKLRVYTKEPGKKQTERPTILEKGSTAKTLAEKILHGFSKKVKETKVWGPSSKFPGQKVGLNHELKDMDIVEFKTN